MAKPVLILTLARCGQLTIKGPKDVCWFALQCSSGFDGLPPPPADLEKEVRGIMPWRLLGVHADDDETSVALRAYLVRADGSSASIAVNVAKVPGSRDKSFARAMRDKAETQLVAVAENDAESVLWRFPADRKPDDKEGAAVGKFLHYLATLPGDAALQSGTAVFFSVPAETLFSFPAGKKPEPLGTHLWVAPAHVEHGGQLALAVPPVKAGSDTYFASGYGPAADPKLAVVGPGLALPKLLTPLDHPVFSLSSYGAGVRGANSDLTNLESLILDATDSATRTQSLTDSLVQENFRMVVSGGPATVIPDETRVAFKAADPVIGFLGRCEPAVYTEVVAIAGELLALQLVEDGQARQFRDDLKRRVQPLGINGRDGGEQALSLARLLGVKGSTLPEILPKLAGECTEKSFCKLLVTGLGATLADPTGPALAEGAREIWEGMSKQDGGAGRQLALAQIAWRDWREVNEALPLLDSLSSATRQLGQTRKGQLRINVGNALAQKWQKSLHLRGITALLRHGWLEQAASVVLADPAPDSAQQLAEGALAIAWRTDSASRSTPTPSSSGLSFAIGEEENELIHLLPGDTQEADWSNGFTEVTGFGILVRRASPGQDLTQRPWKLVTGGVGRLSSGETLNVPMAVPKRVVFDRNLWRAETEYAGTPLLTRSLLDDAYATTGYGITTAAGDDQQAGLITFLSPTEAGNPVEQLSAPPLRYGDDYEVASFVIDQGTGLPAALAKRNAPWALNPAALDRLPDPATGAHSYRTPYLRRSPVGDAMVLPGGTGDQWPPLPAEVSCRSTEWWRATDAGEKQPPAVLLRGEGDTAISNTVDTDASFAVLPPSVDEHVLMRWAAPPAGAMTEALMEALVEAYAELLAARPAVEGLPGVAQTLLPHDPAVSAIGVRARFADEDGQLHEKDPQLIVAIQGLSSKRPFTARPLQIQLHGTTNGRGILVDAAALTVNVKVPAGEFVCMEFYPLVREDDFRARFSSDDTALLATIAGEAGFSGYVAFKPSVVLAETATATLPAAHDLYAEFQVLDVSRQRPATPVTCLFSRTVPLLQMLDRFTIQRQKWIWRNLPMLMQDDLLSLSGPQLLRRLSGGLPDAAFAAAPDGDTGVSKWESIASLDNGLSTRPSSKSSWPRESPHGDIAGGPRGDALLLEDALDGAPPGEYLRYSLTVHSRYAAVIVDEANRSRQMEGPGDDRWRRRVCGFRGKHVKALKILGVVPLTESLADKYAPVPSFSQGSTPCMVLLDECWFREYGVNERLEVVLALESPEIIADVGTGKTAEERDLRPYRAGPLPDHHHPEKSPEDPYDASRYFQRRLTNEAGDALQPMALEVFGPFGFSMDSTPDEALANATAFIVSPPVDWLVKPHWAMFIKLRRVLDYPGPPWSGDGANLRSDWSDAKAVYTLPDARTLCSGTGHAIYEAAENAIKLDGLQWTLHPGTDTLGKSSPAVSDYRYFVMVSREVTDAANETAKEVPVGLFRLDPAGAATFRSNETVKVTWLGNTALPNSRLRGRLMEVWAEARLDGREAQLDRVRTTREFWDALLKPTNGFGDEAQAQDDAAGMIRRVSGFFPIVTG